MISKELEKIDIKSFASMSGMVTGTLLLIIGIIYAAIVLSGGIYVIGLSPAQMAVTAIFGGFFGGLIMGLIFGAIIAFLYNLVASKVGGIEINVE